VWAIQVFENGFLFLTIFIKFLISPTCLIVSILSLSTKPIPAES
jgi:hypothetical protein